jgi:hypothetical protein
MPTMATNSTCLLAICERHVQGELCLPFSLSPPTIKDHTGCLQSALCSSYRLPPVCSLLLIQAASSLLSAPHTGCLQSALCSSYRLPPVSSLLRGWLQLLVHLHENRRSHTFERKASCKRGNRVEFAGQENAF